MSTNISANISTIILTIVERLLKQVWLVILILGLLLMVIGSMDELEIGTLTLKVTDPDSKFVLKIVSVLLLLAGFALLFFHRGLAPDNPGTDAAIISKELQLYLDEDIIRGFESEFLTHIPDRPDQPTSMHDLLPSYDMKRSDLVIRYQSLIRLFSDLGLIAIDEQSRVCPVSVLAGCFIKSMGIHIKQGLDFIGGWQAHGRDNPEARRPRDILRVIEERRIRETPAGEAEPARRVKSALILLKAKFNGDDRYLMQFSDSWARRRPWFIGGIVTLDDDGFEACAYRKLKDELNVTRSDVVSLQRIGRPLTYCRISGRLGAYTEYEFRLFYALLKTERPVIGDLFHLESEINTSGSDFRMIKRENRWYTLAEIASDEGLGKDAGVILDELIEITELIPAHSYPIVSAVS